MKVEFIRNYAKINNKDIISLRSIDYIWEEDIGDLQTFRVLIRTIDNLEILIQCDNEQEADTYINMFFEYLKFQN